MRALFAALFIVLAGAGPAATQEAPPITFGGRGTAALDARIRDWLRDPGRAVWTGDTLIGRSDTVRTPVLVVGGTARIEGTVLGDLVGIGADLFVRPGARLIGDVTNIAGGYYVSDRAEVTGQVEDEPNAPYEIERDGDRIRIIGTEQRSALALDGLYGFEIPTYDRVDGLSLRWGASLALPRLERIEPQLHGWAGYRSERGAFDGGGELVFARGTTELAGGVERTTLTNEAWIRGDVMNSLNYLLQGKDYRDYYEADRAWVELRRVLEQGERTTRVWLRGQVEEASSLRADDPWSILKPDSVRSNLPIDEGQITSAIAGADMLWERPTTLAALTAIVEAAGDPLGGDAEFVRYELAGEWAMLVVRDHTLDIEWQARGPLPGTVSLPRQRWSFVGGSGTLHTFDLAQFRGDRLVFAETRYSIPLGARFRLRFLGTPALDLLHAVGMAWTAAEKRSFEQNVGLRLRYSYAFVRAVTNPEDFTDDVKVSFGLTFPRRSYPWQESGGFF